jgi:hypothetical protein
MEPKIGKNRKIQTRNKSGKENGFLVPIFNIHDGNIDSDQSTQQVYLLNHGTFESFKQIS